MSDSAAQAAAAIAAQEAARQFNIELWTLYAIAILVITLRTYSRIKQVGVKGFEPDDYLVWVAAVIYTAQVTLGYELGNAIHGLANDAMTDAQRAALSANDPEYAVRVLGSQIQIAGWTTYASLSFTLKSAMLFFYIRLTKGLGRRYGIRVQIGFALVIATYVASVLAIYTPCQPFYKNWQINPNPGNLCQPAVSAAIVWTTYISNILTDIFLIFIPVPLLWESSLRLLKKVFSTLLLGAGVLVLVAATLKTVFILTDPINGGTLAGQWGTIEIFVAVCTTNLPMVYPLIRTWLKPIIGSSIGSSNKKSYKSPSGFRNIGGSAGIGGNSQSRSRNRGHGPSVDQMTTHMAFSESEERIVDDIKLQNLKAYAAASGKTASKAIVVSNEFEVRSEDGRSHHVDQNPQPGPRVYQNW